MVLHPRAGGCGHDEADGRTPSPSLTRWVVWGRRERGWDSGVLVLPIPLNSFVTGRGRQWDLATSSCANEVTGAARNPPRSRLSPRPSLGHPERSLTMSDLNCFRGGWRGRGRGRIGVWVLLWIWFWSCFFRAEWAGFRRGVHHVGIGLVLVSCGSPIQREATLIAGSLPRRCPGLPCGCWIRISPMDMPHPPPIALAILRHCVASPPRLLTPESVLLVCVLPSRSAHIPR
jgi:hypothetical protein